jgi:ubiquinone/menaquinone biosynthesis C-methylase UbiE
LCQQGLQFFPEKLVALREMHRVLVSGGRVLLSVWRSAVLTTLRLLKPLNGMWTPKLRRSIAPHGWCRMQRICANGSSRQGSVRCAFVRAP